MTDLLTHWNAALNGLVWGPPMLILLVGTGIVLTVLTGGVQFRHLGTALKEVLGKLTQKTSGAGSVTPFQAVATALASTVGVGNIAGVATAIYLGGPGALFWLWVSGVFAALTAVAAFGIGNMVQANSVAESLRVTFGTAPAIVGVVLVAITAVVILGGIKRIADVTQYLVPFMALFYLAGGLVIILLHAGELPRAFGLVFEGAFTGTAAGGGFAGATIMLAMRYGVARGLFSNEAGLGSAPMVHAAAQTDHPVRQGMYGIFEVFVDTILICSVTGLVILVTGVWDSGATGAALSTRAFATGLPGAWGGIVVTTGLVLFAYSTIIGWSYYGETAIIYLLGVRAAVPYRLAWLVFIYLGATGSLHLVWDIADTLNGLMAIPNLIAVLVSIPVLLRLQKEFFDGSRVTPRSNAPR